jgi:hypothetical protein
MENPRVTGEYGLDGCRIGEVHHLAHHRVLQREHLAVATSARGHELRPPPHHQHELQRAGQPRAGGQANLRCWTHA